MPVPTDTDISLTREELYEKVWAEPMWTLASRFGLSDVGLAKTCRRYQVPVPPRGYWQQKQAGQTVRPTKLPKLPVSAGARLATITFRRPTSSTHQEKPQQEVPLIPVSRELVDPHPLIAHTIRALRRVKPAKNGMLTPSASSNHLDVRVSLGSVDRAMRIMDAFARACDDRGYAISVRIADKEAVSQVEVDGVAVAFHVEETVDSVPIPPEERKHQRPGLWHPPQEKTDVPNGLLGFYIDANWTWYSGNVRRSWRDGKKQRLEECLGRVIVGLQEAARAIKESQAAFDENQRRYKEEARQRKHKAWLAYVEKKNREIIHDELKTMRTIAELRSYVEFRRAREANPSEVLQGWLAWVSSHADRLEDHILKHAGPIVEPCDENSYFY